MPIRLLIADDHDLVREGLRYAFGNTEIEVVAEAATAEAAVRLGLEQELDIMLLDMRWTSDNGGKADGFGILEQLKSAKPDLPVVIYSAHDRTNYIQRCRDLGASGYLVKTVSNRELVIAIEAVSNGENLWNDVPVDQSQKHWPGPGN